MRKCRNCKVEILDDTAVCPLCSSVLEASGEETGGGAYPDVKSVLRKRVFIIRLYSYLAIITEAALVAVNYLNFHGVWWSAISGIGILYLYVALKASLQKHNGYQAVILVQIVGAVLLVILTDNILGYRGWSVNYVLPAAVLFLDATVIVLMLVNLSHWQSYIPMQLLTTAASAACLLLWRLKIITSPILTVVAAALSACLLLGTLIFGDRKAKAELKRRFHV